MSAPVHPPRRPPRDAVARANRRLRRLRSDLQDVEAERQEMALAVAQALAARAEHRRISARVRAENLRLRLELYRAQGQIQHLRARKEAAPA